MVLGGHAQRLHGDVLQRQQELGAVGKEQVHVGTAESHYHVRRLEIAAGCLLILDLVFHLESRIAQGSLQKTVDPDAYGSYRVLSLTHWLFPADLLLSRFHGPGGFRGRLGVVEEPLLTHTYQVAGQVV